MKAFPNLGGGEIYDGMDLRDYFASHAPPPSEQWMSDALVHGYHVVEGIASWNYCYAAAMMEERNKSQ